MKVCFPVSSVIHTRLPVLEGGTWGVKKIPIRYGLIQSPVHGAILIDTGYTSDIFGMEKWLPRLYAHMFDPIITWGLEPQFFIRSFGLEPNDIKHIIVTHLHADHISGLQHFPHAQLHVSRQAYEMVCAPHKHEAWHGFFRELWPTSCPVKMMDDHPTVDLGLGVPCFAFLGDPSLVLVELDGHMHGHIGVAMTISEGKILYASDVSWSRQGYKEGKFPLPPLGWAVHDKECALRAMRAVRVAENKGWHVVLCHDPQPTPFDHTVPFRFPNPYGQEASR